MLRSLIALLALAATAGCSLVNPFVIGPAARQAAIAPGGRAQNEPKITSVDDAKRYAAWVKGEYRGALGDQAQLQSWLGIGLIPLSAAAMGIGAAGGPGSAVLALGLTGASAFGTSMWLTNKPRHLAYVAGIKAVTCAVDAVESLGEIDAGHLRTNLSALEVQIPLLERVIADLAQPIADLERSTPPTSPTISGC